MNQYQLRGCNHTQPGVIERRAGDSVAIALCRGGAPKLYPHTDPNEDSSLCAEGPQGSLIAVADGHGGHEGADAALEYLATQCAEGWLEDPQERNRRVWRRELATAIEGSHQRVLEVHREERAPRSTLAFAMLRRPERVLVAASLGDSHLFLVTQSGHCFDLGWARRRAPNFLGQRDMDPARLRRSIALTTRPCRDLLAIVAATDGVSETGIGLPNPAAAVERAVKQARRKPLSQRSGVAAAELAEAARAAQERNCAGDSIAVGVMWWDGEKS